MPLNVSSINLGASATISDNIFMYTPIPPDGTLHIAIGTPDDYVDAVIINSSGISLGAVSINTENIWEAQQTPFNGTLTDGATINWDADVNGQVVTVTLADNRTLAAPTNIIPNTMYLIRVIQDATGGRTLTWDSAYKFPEGTAPTLTSTANAVDLFSFIGNTGNTLEYIGQDIR
jgi:hypothetical protein